MNPLQTIKSTLKLILILILLILSLWFVFTNYYPCLEPLKYSIGTIDKSFKINKQKAVTVAKKAEKIWERSTGLNLLEYDQNAKLKLNFHYDQRQKNFDTAQRQERKINKSQKVIESKKNQYKSKLAKYNTQLIQYREIRTRYQQDSLQLNKEILYWNSNGGAPKDIYDDLQKQQNLLDNQYTHIKKIEDNLNTFAKQLELESQNLNTIIKNYNKTIDNFNNTFNKTKEFDQGDYDSGNINLYYFENQDDLIMLIAHEMGHALGLEHVQNKKSLMYYLMKDQNKKNFTLTKEDIEELNRVCHIEKKYSKIKKTYDFIKNTYSSLMKKVGF